MDTLSRISSTFENVRKNVKNKNSSTRIQHLKKDIQTISTELVVLGKENHDQFVRSLAMEGYLALLSAKTLPLSLPEKRNILKTSFEKLKSYAMREECLFVLLRLQNLLCYYLIQLDQISFARDILEGMEDFYDQISTSLPDKFIDAEDLFTIQPIENIKRISPDKINTVITNNIQMQAFLYNKLDYKHKYTLYNHLALRRQLELKEGTPQYWALRTARLGNYFTYLNQMKNARHHLCAAYHVLRTCHDNCKLMPGEFVTQKADFEVHFLELSHHWVKYGLTLFKVSKKKILNKYFSHQRDYGTDLWKTVDLLEDKLDSSSEKEDEENSKDVESEKFGKGDCSSQKSFSFPSLELNEMEVKVPIDIIRTVDEARKLFSFTYKWLMRVKHYYDFEHHTAQYISCSLQLAELYEHLAFFERNIDNQYSVQKRRANILETLNSLLKTCDNVLTVQIDVIRELSQVQLELMALNLQKLWREESHTDIINMDADADSIINSLGSGSNKTLTEKTLNTTSKNMFLRKMEAATYINNKLGRLSGHLVVSSPSQLSFDTEMFNNNN